MLTLLLCSLVSLAIIAASPSVSASLPSAVHSKGMSMPYEEVYADGTIRQITAPDAPANPLRQPLVDPTPDPYLEPGFPIYTNPTGGSYIADPAINALVGSIDSDPTLEILATGLCMPGTLMARSGPYLIWMVQLTQPLGSCLRALKGWRLSDRAIISGYRCGGPSEPCGPGNLPYLLAGNNASRGQITKIISNAAGLVYPPTGLEEVAAGGYCTATLWLDAVSSARWREAAEHAERVLDERHGYIPADDSIRGGSPAFDYFWITDQLIEKRLHNP